MKMINELLLPYLAQNGFFRSAFDSNAWRLARYSNEGFIGLNTYYMLHENAGRDINVMDNVWLELRLQVEALKGENDRQHNIITPNNE